MIFQEAIVLCKIFPVYLLYLHFLESRNDIKNLYIIVAL